MGWGEGGGGRRMSLDTKRENGLGWGRWGKKDVTRHQEREWVGVGEGVKIGKHKL